MNVGYQLHALPLLSLYEHVACQSAKSTTLTAHARLQRSKALTQLGLLDDAFYHLRSLQLGQGLPKMAGSVHNSNLDLVNPVDDVSFSTLLPANDPHNLRALQVLAETTMVLL